MQGDSARVNNCVYALTPRRRRRRRQRGIGLHIYISRTLYTVHPPRIQMECRGRGKSFFFLPLSFSGAGTRLPVYLDFLTFPFCRRCGAVQCLYIVYFRKTTQKSEGFPTSVSLTFLAKKVHGRGERMNYLGKKAPLLACKETREECNPPFPHLFSSVRIGREGGTDLKCFFLSSPLPPFFSP